MKNRKSTTVSCNAFARAKNLTAIESEALKRVESINVEIDSTGDAFVRWAVEVENKRVCADKDEIDALVEDTIAEAVDLLREILDDVTPDVKWTFSPEDDPYIEAVELTRKWWLVYEIPGARHECVLNADDMEKASMLALEAWQKMSASTQLRCEAFDVLLAQSYDEEYDSVADDTCSERFNFLGALHDVQCMDDLADLIERGVCDDMIHYIGEKNIRSYIKVNGVSTLAVQFDGEIYAPTVVLDDDGWVYQYDQYEEDSLDDDTIRAIQEAATYDVDEDYCVVFPNGKKEYVNDLDGILFVINTWLSDQDGEVQAFPVVTNIVGRRVWIDYHCAHAKESAVVRAVNDSDEDEVEYLFEEDAECYRYKAQPHSSSGRCVFTNDELVDSAASNAYALAYRWLIDNHYRQVGCTDEWIKGDQKVFIEVIEYIASDESTSSSWIITE